MSRPEILTGIRPRPRKNRFAEAANLKNLGQQSRMNELNIEQAERAGQQQQTDASKAAEVRGVLRQFEANRDFEGARKQLWSIDPFVAQEFEQSFTPEEPEKPKVNGQWVRRDGEWIFEDVQIGATKPVIADAASGPPMGWVNDPENPGTEIYTALKEGIRRRVPQSGGRATEGAIERSLAYEAWAEKERVPVGSLSANDRVAALAWYKGQMGTFSPGQRVTTMQTVMDQIQYLNPAEAETYWEQQRQLLKDAGLDIPPYRNLTPEIMEEIESTGPNVSAGSAIRGATRIGRAQAPPTPAPATPPRMAVQGEQYDDGEIVVGQDGKTYRVVGPRGGAQ